MNIKVVHHIDIGGCDNLEFIGVTHQSDDVILLHIDLRTKRAELSDGGGDNGIHSFWVGGDEIRVPVPFDDYVTFHQTSRYTIFIGIFRRSLVENMPIVWKNPEQPVELDDIGT